MRLVLAIAALAALVVALLGSGQAPEPAAASGAASTAQRTPAPVPPAPVSEAGSAARPPAPPPLYAVETAVRAARLRGAGENEIHRLRASALPAAQVASLVAMEAAEASWLDRVAQLRRQCASGAGCGAERFTPEERARLRSYGAPALRQ